MRAAPRLPRSPPASGFFPQIFPETSPTLAHAIHNAQSLPVCFARTNISLAFPKQRVNIAYV